VNTVCGASSEHSCPNGQWLQKCYLRLYPKCCFICSDCHKMRICFSRQLWKNKSNGRTRKKIIASTSWSERKKQDTGIKSGRVERTLRKPRFGTGYGRVVTQITEWMDLTTACHSTDHGPLKDGSSATRCSPRTHKQCRRVISSSVMTSLI